MFILEADNRVITDDLVYSYLSNNYISGASTLKVVSSYGFSSNDYLLLESFGEEKAEIVQIDSISGNEFTLKNNTSFSHSETTSIYKILYNQVKFYRTEEDSFNTDTLLDTVDINPQSYYTFHKDTVYDSGFGWFVFYNSDTGQSSAPSNAIPYTDFSPNSAQKIVERFFNSLNNTEANLISFDEAFSYLSEGYTKLYNELNLVNQEYTMSDVYEYVISAGTQEKELPSDFSSIVSISREDGKLIEPVSPREIREYKNNPSANTKYYLRGSKIGFVPIPEKETKYYMYYNALAKQITSYSDKIRVPNNNFYCLQDFMMYRAAPKLQRSDGSAYYQMFLTEIENMKINSIKRSSNPSSWDIAPEACV
jgi:hypothetical protein